ncbi:MAG: protein-export chaperone SecB [Rhodospirillales bacterium]|nr:protein-export chaperone SecB [Rhodospirillales bacterium]
MTDPANGKNTSAGPEGAPTEDIVSGEERGSSQVPADDARPPLIINNQYIKDLSFEAPAVPKIFEQIQSATPDIGVNVNVQARPLDDTRFEVSLQTRAECKAGGAMAFLVELTYCGVFTVNVAAEHLRPILLIECPRLLFPFARHIIANATRDGGFPPLLLGPIDFVSMYQRQMQERAAKGGDGGADGAAIA